MEQAAEVAVMSACGKRRIHDGNIEPVMRGVEDRERPYASEQRGNAPRLGRVDGCRSKNDTAQVRQRTDDARRDPPIGIGNNNGATGRRRFSQITRGNSAHGACTEDDERQLGISAAR
jgi:hypothetical protein